MAPNAKVKAAFVAMRDIGISETKTKPVLKKLYKLFDKNWDAIEAENYRVLADAIFEEEENEIAQNAEKEKEKPENGQRGEGSEVPTWQDGPMQDENMEDEPERPLKRLRLKHQGQGASSNGQPSPAEGALKIPKPEPGEPDATLTTASPLVRNKGKQPVSSSNTGANSGRVHSSASKKAAQALKNKEAMAALLKPKDEPFTDDMLSIEPLAVIHPDPDSPLNKAPSNSANQVGSQDDERPATDVGVDNGTRSMTSTAKEKQLQEADVSDRPPAKINIAASTLGNVQISLTCDPVSKGHEMHLPDLEAVMKKVDDHCLKTYKIADPEFSVAKLMKQFCDCVEELGKSANGATEIFNGQDDPEI